MNVNRSNTSGNSAYDYRSTLGSHENSWQQLQVMNMGVSEIRVPYFGGPYNKDPVVWSTLLGSPRFGNPHIAQLQRHHELAATQRALTTSMGSKVEAVSPSISECGLRLPP